MYYNGQHAFDHSCVYRVTETGRNGELLLDQYLILTLSCFFNTGVNGLTKNSIGKFIINTSLDVIGKVYVNEYGYLFEDCGKPVGFYINQKYNKILSADDKVFLGTSDSKLLSKMHDYCSKLINQILDKECKYEDREIPLLTHNGIKLIDISNSLPLSPFAVKCMKEEFGNISSEISSFNLLSTQKRELENKNKRPFNHNEEKKRAMDVAAKTQGGPSSYRIN